MVRFVYRLHTPVEAGAEIIRQIRSPSGERVVATGGAVPGVGLICVVVRQPRILLVGTVDEAARRLPRMAGSAQEK